MSNRLESETLIRLSEERVALNDKIEAPNELIASIKRKTRSGSSLFTITYPDEKNVGNRLNKTKERLQQEHGINPSKPFLTGMLLMYDLHDRCCQEASQLLEQQKYSEFALMFDLAHGIGYIPSLIATAESHIAGHLEEFTEGVNFSADQSHFVLPQMAERFAQELIGDVSGFKLVDFGVQHIDQNWDQYPGTQTTIKEIFMAGATTSQALYKTIYPITENLSPMEQA